MVWEQNHFSYTEEGEERQGKKCVCVSRVCVCLCVCVCVHCCSCCCYTMEIGIRLLWNYIEYIIICQVHEVNKKSESFDFVSLLLTMLHEFTTSTSSFWQNGLQMCCIFSNHLDLCQRVGVEWLSLLNFQGFENWTKPAVRVNVLSLGPSRSRPRPGLVGPRESPVRQRRKGI